MGVFADADAQIFEMIGDCYAKDKYNIYEERLSKLESVDYASFKTKFDLGCIGRDKKGNWFWGNREDLNDLIHDNQLKRWAKVLAE